MLEKVEGGVRESRRGLERGCQSGDEDVLEGVLAGAMCC